MCVADIHITYSREVCLIRHTHHPLKESFPSEVSRYFCRGLRGWSGSVIWIHPFPIADNNWFPEGEQAFIGIEGVSHLTGKSLTCWCILPVIIRTFAKSLEKRRLFLEFGVAYPSRRSMMMVSLDEIEQRIKRRSCCLERARRTVSGVQAVFTGEIEDFLIGIAASPIRRNDLHVPSVAETVADIIDREKGVVANIISRIYLSDRLKIAV